MKEEVPHVIVTVCKPKPKKVRVDWVMDAFVKEGCLFLTETVPKCAQDGISHIFAAGTWLMLEWFQGNLDDGSE